MYTYYKCAAAKKKKTCDKKAVRKQWLEDLVVNETMKLVEDDASMNAIIAKVMELQNQESTDLPIYEKQLKETEVGITNMLNAIQMGILTSSTEVHPVPKEKTAIDRTMTLGELNHSRSPLGWLVWLVLTILLDVSYKRGKPDLNILFQYNMPLRALAKMTNGAISMGMVDGIVMELQGFWILGLVRVIYEAIKNVVLNAQMEKRLRGA